MTGTHPTGHEFDAAIVLAAVVVIYRRAILRVAIAVAAIVILALIGAGAFTLAQGLHL